MTSKIIAAFCIIDDALKAIGHKHDPQTKVPTSAILTLALLATTELGGNYTKALDLAKDLRRFSSIPSKSRFNRRLHRAKPLFLPLLHLLCCLWKELHTVQRYALDTFPIPVCENIRAPCSRIAPERIYRGYIPSKRVYFHGYKLHLLVDEGRFIHKVELTPGSFHDLTCLLLLPFNDVEAGQEVYMDRGYESQPYEELLQEALGVVPRVVRKRSSKRYVPHLQYLSIAGRRVVETVGSMLHTLFLRRIRAVTEEGFILKVLFFVLAHNLNLVAEKIL